MREPSALRPAPTPGTASAAPVPSNTSSTITTTLTAHHPLALNNTTSSTIGLTPTKAQPLLAMSKNAQARRREHTLGRAKVKDAKPGALLREHFLCHFCNTVVPSSASSWPSASIWIPSL
jgi:hypothetical protein